MMKGFFLVAAKYTSERVMKAWMKRPMMTVSMYSPRRCIISPGSSMSRIFPQTRNMIPTGEYLQNKGVIIGDNTLRGEHGTPRGVPGNTSRQKRLLFLYQGRNTVKPGYSEHAYNEFILQQSNRFVLTCYFTVSMFYCYELKC